MKKEQEFGTEHNEDKLRRMKSKERKKQGRHDDNESVLEDGFGSKRSAKHRSWAIEDDDIDFS